MARKTTLVLLALAVLSGLVAAYLVLRPVPVNESEHYRDVVTIVGHQRVDRQTHRSAYAVFVGRPLTDAEVAVNVYAPHVKWAHEEEATANGDLSLVAEGYGTLDGVRCYVKVARIRPGAAATAVGAGKLTVDQQAGLMGGSLEAIKVAVLCDPQDESTGGP